MLKEVEGKRELVERRKRVVKGGKGLVERGWGRRWA